jgi:chromosomal replication initiation ATPase DnaA
LLDLQTIAPSEAAVADARARRQEVERRMSAFVTMVMLAVEDATGFSLEDLQRPGRKHSIVVARKAAAWLLAEVAELGYSASGRLLRRDRTTIAYHHLIALDDADTRYVIETVLRGRDRQLDSQGQTA